MKGKNKGKTHRNRSTATSKTVHRKAQTDSISYKQESPPQSIAVPSRVGTDISFFQSADETIDVHVLSNVLKCKSSPNWPYMTTFS